MLFAAIVQRVHSAACLDLAVELGLGIRVVRRMFVQDFEPGDKADAAFKATIALSPAGTRLVCELDPLCLDYILNGRVWIVKRQLEIPMESLSVMGLPVDGWSMSAALQFLADRQFDKSAMQQLEGKHGR